MYVRACRFKNEFKAKPKAQHTQFQTILEAQRQRITDLEAALAEKTQQTAPDKLQLEAETDEKDREARRALDAAVHATDDKIFGCLQLAQKA